MKTSVKGLEHGKETPIGIRGCDLSHHQARKLSENIFGTKGAAWAFEKALFEAAKKCHWVIHAYVVMSNHFHLAVETREGNLVSGMAWLQGTYTNRFNRFQGERGHVFQGRYKSILIEEGRPLLGWVNYIHLNPVRANLVGVGELESNAFSTCGLRASDFSRFPGLKLQHPLHS